MKIERTIDIDRNKPTDSPVIKIYSAVIGNNHWAELASSHPPEFLFKQLQSKNFLIVNNGITFS